MCMTLISSKSNTPTAYFQYILHNLLSNEKKNAL